MNIRKQNTLDVLQFETVTLRYKFFHIQAVMEAHHGISNQKTNRPDITGWWVFI